MLQDEKQVDQYLAEMKDDDAEEKSIDLDEDKRRIMFHQISTPADYAQFKFALKDNHATQASSTKLRFLLV